MARAALPVLRDRRSGHFIQISSIGGRVGGTPGLGAYQTAKFGVEGLSEVLANEVAALGIKVTIVEPGGIRTGWAEGAALAAGSIQADYERRRAGRCQPFDGLPERVGKRCGTTCRDDAE